MKRIFSWGKHSRLSLCAVTVNVAVQSDVQQSLSSEWFELSELQLGMKIHKGDISNQQSFRREAGTNKRQTGNNLTVKKQDS